MNDHTDFALAFSTQARVEGSWSEVWSVRVEPLGHLRLQSGRIVVGDPFTGGLSDGPLARVAPIGRFPVDLSIVRRPAAADHDERIAAARITFSTAEVVSWEPALFEGQTADSDGIPGYGVDAGTGCFACADQAPALDTEDAGDVLLEHFENTGVPTWSAAGHPSAPEAVMAFSSGWGDGFYGSWWGLDANGEPVVLVTDFDVLTMAVEETTTVTLPRKGPVHDALTERLGGVLRVQRSWLGQVKLVHDGPSRPFVEVADQQIEGAYHFGGISFAVGRLAAGSAVALTYITGQRPSRALTPD